MRPGEQSKKNQTLWWDLGDCNMMPKMPSLKTILNTIKRIILVHPASIIVFTTRKHFQVAGYKNFKTQNFVCLIYSLICSLTCSFTCSLTHSLARSLTRLLTHSLACSLTHSLTRSLTHSLPHWPQLQG